MKIRQYSFLLSLVISIAFIFSLIPAAVTADDSVQDQPISRTDSNTSDFNAVNDTEEYGSDVQDKTPPRLILSSLRTDGLKVEIGGAALPGYEGVEIIGTDWDWGDGQFEERRFPAAHAYSQGGKYLVNVTARQDDGLIYCTFINLSLTEKVSPDYEKAALDRQPGLALTATSVSPPSTTAPPPPPPTTTAVPVPVPVPTTTPKPLDLTKVVFPENEGGSISGHVYQADGVTPVAAVKISADLSVEIGGSTGTYHKESNSSPDGSYTISGLPSGNYLVSAQAAGYVPYYFHNTSDSGSATEVRVNMPDNTPDIDFILDRGGSFSGYVLESDGATPISGAEVFCKSSDDSPHMSALSSEDGSYTLSGLLSGNYRVWAEAPGYLLEYFNNTNFSYEATPVEITLPDNTPGINFTLDKGGSISGRVYQTDHVTPVAGARVKAVSVEGNQNQEITSSADGSFVIAGLLSGNYRVTASAAGYLREYYNGAGSSAAAAVVAVSSPVNTPDIDFTLDTGGSISGYVYQADGVTPVSGAQVYAESTDKMSEMRAVSASDGTFMLSGLPSGDYIVSAQAEGFLSEYYNGSPGYATAMPVGVTLPENIPGINFMLDTGGSVSGHVYQTDAVTPVPGALVILESINGNIYRGTFSNSTGSYTIAALPSGSYRVYAGAGGYLTEFYCHMYYLANAAPVCVTSPAGTTGIDFSLEEGGSISGYVYHSAGLTPISGAVVRADSSDGRYYWTVDSRSDGSYIFPQLPPGSYRVSAQASGCLKKYFDNAFSSSRAALVPVTLHNNTSNINFTLDAGGSISGHVYQQDGSTSVSGASVSAEWINGSKYTSVLSAADGSYLFQGLPSGDYRVYAQADGYVGEYFENAYIKSNAESVAVAGSAATLDIDFTLETGGSISGHVYQADGITPLSEAYVSAQLSGGGTSRSAYSSSDGSYTISLLPTGNYIVLAQANGYMTQYFDDVSVSSAAAPVGVTQPDNTPDINFRLDRGGSISGHVYQSDSITPLSGAYVYARLTGGYSGGGSYTSSDGSYTIYLRSPGDYTVYASSSGYLTQYFDHAENEATADSVNVIIPGNTPGIDFSLDEGGSISGHVYRENGITPLYGAYVYAYRSNGIGVSAYSNSDGSYTIPELPSGNYTVYARFSGYVTRYYNQTDNYYQAAPVIVTRPEDTTDIDFSLNTGGSISGHVYQVDGATPVSGVKVYAYSTDGQWHGETGSSTDGSYSISVLAAGSYFVYARSGGFLTQYFDHTGNETEAAPVNVTQAGDTPGIDFSLRTGGSISGNIYQADGITPVSGASISAVLPDGSTGGSASSCSDGSYLISGLPPRDYLLRVSSNGYLTQYFDHAGTAADAAAISITECGNATDIDFNLETGGSISGHVFQVDGLTPVPGAYIRAYSSNGEYAGKAGSSSDGSYKISVLSSGKYRVAVQADGYLEEYYDNTSKYSEATLVEVIQPYDTPDIDFTLDTGGSISGRICQSDGVTPLSDVYINAYISGSEYFGKSSYSGEDGSYTLSSLPSGNYQVSAQVDGFIREYYSDAYYSSDANLVAVSAPNITSGIDFTLDIGASISGHIYQSDGITPLANVHVQANLSGSHYFASSSYSGEDGSYTLSSLPSGDYRVGAQGEGYVLEYYGGTYYSPDAVLVAVSAPDNTGGIDFTLDMGGSISGHVYQEDGVTPVPDAQVSATLSFADHDITSYSTSGEDGSYVIPELPSGSYRVRASSQDYMLQYYDGAYVYENATPVNVVMPNDTPGIDFSMEKGGSISGHIFKSDGVTPISGATIFADLSDWTSGRIARSSSDGSYKVTGLSSGNYLVQVAADGYVSEYYKNTYFQHKATLVSVTRLDDTPGIDFALDTGGSISGYVFQSDGITPISEAWIHASSTQGGYSNGAHASSDGSYTISVLPAGNYRVYAQADGYIDQYFDNVASLASATPVAVVSPADTPNINFRLSKGGSISGHVYLADGKTPVAEAFVSASSTTVGFGGDTTTNTDGSYYIPGLPSDNYQVQVEKDGYISFYGDYIVEVTDPLDTGDVDFKLITGGSISGNVYQADGATPVPGASVHAYQTDQGTGDGQAVTDSNGSYTISMLYPGNYNVRVTADGYIREYYDGTRNSGQASPVNVKDQVNTPDINFTLDTGGSISGHIYQPDGSTPVAYAYVSASLQGGDGYSRSTNSAADGSYIIETLSSGNYVLQVTATSFVREYYQNSYFSNAATLVAVASPDTVTDIDFVLDEGGSISGHVYQVDGATPVPGATIVASPADKIKGLDSGQAITAPDGSYTIRALYPGNYVLSVSAEGYVREYYDGKPGAGEATPVNVIDLADTAGIDFTLDTGGSISGHIYQTDGITPVNNAYISAALQGNYSYSRSTRSASDGSYFLSTLPSGNYLLEVNAQDFLTEYYINSYFSKAATLVEVASPDTTPDIDFTLETGGSISGHVYRADGTTPIAKVRVYGVFNGEDYDFTEYVYSASDGSYQIKAVLPGNYVVRAEASGYLEGYYRGNRDQNVTLPVSVSMDNDTPDINFILDKGGSISGHIYQADGATGVSGVRVNAGILGESTSYSIPSLADGSYLFSSLKPGLYQVYISTPGFVRNYYKNSHSEAAAPVAVSLAMETSGIDFTLDPGGSISGHVYQSDGSTPLAGANVHAYLADQGYSSQTTTATDGSYTIEALFPGDYKVRAYTSDYIPEYYPETSNSAGAIPVTVTDLMNTGDIDFTLDKGGSISGHVYQSDGITPLSTGYVIVESTMTELSDFNQASSPARVLSDGSYTITGLAPGEYRVTANAPDFIVEHYNGASDWNEADPVMVNLAADTPHIDFSLEPGGRISGRVYQSDGVTPLSNAMVSFTRGYERTDAEGNYTLSGLATGSYLVSAGASGYIAEYYGGSYYAEEATPVEVTAPDTAGGINFVLDKGGSISGQVYGSDGKSLYLGDFFVNAIPLNTGTRPPSILNAPKSPNYGSYMVSDLPPGDYYVKLKAEDHNELYYDGASTLEEAASITVTPANTTMDIDFILDTSGSNPAPLNTSTTLTSSANPAALGQSVTFTATVSAVPPAAGVPTGSVTFKDGAVEKGTLDLSQSGQVTWNTTALSAGTHIIEAVYQGDSNFASSSWNLTQTVYYPSVGGGGGGGPVYNRTTLNGLSSNSALQTDSRGVIRNAAHLKTEDGRVTLDIAKGTRLLTSNSSPLSILTAAIPDSPPAPSDGNALIMAYTFGPDGAKFDPALTLTFNYDLSASSSCLTYNDLYIACYDGALWQSLGGTVDTTARTISVKISHFSHYALMGKAPEIVPSVSPVSSATPVLSPTLNASLPTPEAASPIAGAVPSAPVSPPAAEDKPSQVTVSPSPVPEDQPVKQTPTWLIIVIVVAVLAVVLVIALIVSRGKKTITR